MAAAPRSGSRTVRSRLALAAGASLLMLAAAPPARATCPGSCPAPAAWTPAFTFAGLAWEKKSGCGGPGPNCWAAANVALADSDGVHLRLTVQSGKWYAAEIRTALPVQPGSYSLELIGRPDLLDPNVVLGVFLYDDAAGDAGDPCPAELDLESSRFGDASAPNGNFVSYGSGLCRAADLLDFSYTLNGTYSTHQIDWAPGSVTYRLLHGHRCAAELPQYLIAERTFDSALIPGAGGMRLHLNLWAFAGQAPTDRQEVEIVVHDVVTTCTAVAAAPLPARDAPAWDLTVHPNPATRAMELTFTMPSEDHVRVTIVDVAGRQVATLVNGVLPAGRHDLRWEIGPRAPGIYVAHLAIGAAQVVRRIAVLR